MKKMGLLLFAVLSVSPQIYSQTTAIQSTQASPAAPSVRVITLGNSVVALDGDWKFQPGDSPWMNGEPEWAQPEYDDAGWVPIDLTPKAGERDPQFNVNSFVPGWTAQGFPKLDGFAWYRLRVRVADPEAERGQPLWLKMPIDFDDGYQVFADGRYIGQCGHFGPNHIRLYFSHPLSFPLPKPDSNGEIVLALRFYMSPSTRFFYADVGGMHQTPMLGLASTVQQLQTADEITDRDLSFGLLLATLLFSLLAPLALWAWLRNRRDRMYLWLFLALGCTIFTNAAQIGSNATYLLSYAAGLCLRDLSFFILPLWIMYWWYWFGLEERRWVVRAAWLLTAAGVLAELCTLLPVMGVNALPLQSLHWFDSAAILLKATLGVLLVLLLVEGFRRDRAEALVAVAPILLLEAGSFEYDLLAIFNLPNRYFIFGLGFTTREIAMMAMGLVVGVLTLRRFVRTQVRQGLERKAIAQDLEQARVLQQRVLVPEVIASKYFAVETEYRPAQTVGGDFFQTLTRPDGSLLVVVGDVSGKGVSAAMLVAVLVGAIRERAEDSFDPASLLARLNRRLLGRSGGHFATCLAAEIAPDGTMRIANAGHIPPYLNGNEMEVEGSLPLGVIAEVEYGSQIFKLSPGDRLTFITDGVLEATNEAKELFGFERTREVSGERAATIVERAQSFGQEDDITVVGVQFAEVAAV
jgi:hypothetical protein